MGSLPWQRLGAEGAEPLGTAEAATVSSSQAAVAWPGPSALGRSGTMSTWVPHQHTLGLNSLRLGTPSGL